MSSRLELLSFPFKSVTKNNKYIANVKYIRQSSRSSDAVGYALVHV